MNEDDKRYSDNQAELNRTHNQGNSNQTHDQIALDRVNWDILSKTAKPVVLDLRCGDGETTVKRFGKYLDMVCGHWN